VATKPKKPNGRPDTFSQVKVDQIVDRVSGHESLRAICLDVGVPLTTFLRWVADRPELSAQYTRAKQMQAELLASEILEIADDGRNDTYVDAESGEERTDHDVIARSKLRVDTRKWVLSKMLPKVYGDKIVSEVKVTGLADILATLGNTSSLKVQSDGDD
jgi:hypothetical protein